MKTTAHRRHFQFDSRSVLLLAAMALTGASSAQAQSKPSPFSVGPASASPMTPPTAASAAFDRADTDRDGKLSPKEAEALPAISSRFGTLDKNHDGFLSREEFDEGAKS